VFKRMGVCNCLLILSLLPAMSSYYFDQTRQNGTTIGVVTPLPVDGQTPGDSRFALPSSWKGIKVLHSTRDQVEDFLGKPTSSELSKQTYDDVTAKLTVWYSTGPCNAVVGRWNVASGVVIAIDVYPARRLLLEDLIFERGKYMRLPLSHPADWVIYSNKQDGIRITTIRSNKNSEIVQSWSYLPPQREDPLRCKR
jgi:hypothetical protein